MLKFIQILSLPRTPCQKNLGVGMIKNKMKNKKTTRKPKAPAVAKVQTVPPPAPKKSHGCLISCIVVIVILFLFGGAISIFGYYFGPGMMASFFSKMFDSRLDYDNPASSKYQIENVVSGELTANMKIPSDAARSSITLTAVDKSNWPKDAKGGMYQLEPSGSKFEKPLTMSVNIKTDPGQRFSLGYWIPEKKDWEWIPTIKRSGNTYEARIEHASYVGAYLPDSTDLSEYDYRLTDKYQRDLFWQYQQELRLLSGEADISGYYDGSGARWLRSRDLLKQLTDSVIKECEKDMSSNRQRDFYFIWGVVQWNSFIGLDELLNKFAQSESRCMYEDQSGTFDANYLIEQIDKYPYEVNVYNMAKSRGQQKSVYWGLPMKKAPWNRYGWQTEWKVFADTTTDALTDVNIQMAPGSQAGLVVGGTTVARMMMMFNLEGVKVGDKFPITVKSTGSYTIHSNVDYPKMIYADKEGKLRFDDKFDEEYGLPTTLGTEEENNQIKSVATISGILLQDMGKDGARIKMEYEGLGAYQDAMENIKKTYEGTEFYNIFFQGGNLDVSMDIPPLLIKPSDQFTNSPVAPPNTPYNNAPYN